jgi:hypothetical protein
MFLFHSVHPKKNSVSALILTLLFSALAGSLFVDLARANAYAFLYSPPSSPSITITSPGQIPPYQYDYPFLKIDSMEVAFTINMHWGYYSFSPVQCRLDGAIIKEFSAFDFSIQVPPPPGPTNSSLSLSFSIAHLSEGLHSVEITVAHASWESGDWAVKNLASYQYVPSGLPELSQDYYSVSSGQFRFWVDNIPPQIFISPQGGKLVVSDASLNFTLSEPVSWLGYSLDGGSLVKVADAGLLDRAYYLENCVALGGLQAGEHILTVYAEDRAGNRGESEPFQFAVALENEGVDSQPSAPEVSSSTTKPFPTTLFSMAIIGSSAVVCFGLVAYLLRRKRRPDGA